MAGPQQFWRLMLAPMGTNPAMTGVRRKSRILRPLVLVATGRAGGRIRGRIGAVRWLCRGERGGHERIKNRFRGRVKDYFLYSHPTAHPRHRSPVPVRPGADGIPAARKTGRLGGTATSSWRAWRSGTISGAGFGFPDPCTAGMVRCRGRVRALRTVGDRNVLATLRPIDDEGASLFLHRSISFGYVSPTVIRWQPSARRSTCLPLIGARGTPGPASFPPAA
jgi:hypothetical protein